MNTNTRIQEGERSRAKRRTPQPSLSEQGNLGEQSPRQPFELQALTPPPACAIFQALSPQHRYRPLPLSSARRPFPAGSVRSCVSPRPDGAGKCFVWRPTAQWLPSAAGQRFRGQRPTQNSLSRHTKHSHKGKAPRTFAAGRDPGVGDLGTLGDRLRSMLRQHTPLRKNSRGSSPVSPKMPRSPNLTVNIMAQLSHLCKPAPASQPAPMPRCCARTPARTALDAHQHGTRGRP